MTRPPRKRAMMSRWPRGAADIEELLRHGELEHVTGGAADGAPLLAQAERTAATAAGLIATDAYGAGPVRLTPWRPPAARATLGQRLLAARKRTSMASRKPSPMKLKPTTTATMQSPAGQICHQYPANV